MTLPNQRVPPPIDDNDAAPKKFVDDEIATEIAAALAGFVAPLPQGYIYGYKVRVDIGGTTMRIFGGLCRDSSNAVDIVKLSSSDANINASGVNGLDTGAPSNNRWYYLFIIDGPSVSVASLLSASPFAPTLPAGYTVFRRVGSGRRLGTGQFRPSTQEGSAPTPVFGPGSAGGISNPRWVWYDDAFTDRQILTAGAATVDTDIDLSAVAPTDALEHQLLVDIRASGQDAIISRGSTDKLRVLAGQQVVTRVQHRPGNFIPTIPPELDYRNAAGGGSTDIFALGYQEIL